MKITANVTTPWARRGETITVTKLTEVQQLYVEKGYLVKGDEPDEAAMLAAEQAAEQAAAEQNAKEQAEFAKAQAEAGQDELPLEASGTKAKGRGTRG